MGHQIIVEMPDNTHARIVSIDIFRALTMLLMIFVNDLWTLNGVPEWMEHARAAEDRMGLADWVFPGFLFIVGLSIPYAVRARKKHQKSMIQVFWHVLQRSLALIIMGFFMVNLENMNDAQMPVSKSVWELLMAGAIVLIWNVYPQKRVFGKVHPWVLQMVGILILVGLALVYKSGTPENPAWMRPYWWGILGIIGWAYFFVASLFLLTGERLWRVGALLILFVFLNIMEFKDFFGYKMSFRLFVSASNYASVLSGVLVTLLYIKFGKAGRRGIFITSLLILAGFMIGFGLLTRPEWGISKIRATPSWTTICAGLSTLIFAVLYYIADVYQKTSWERFIRPAGRSTLTCYLVPYFYYPLMMIVGVFLPEILRTGVVGLVKSFLFALLIIQITNWLEKIHIRLKV